MNKMYEEDMSVFDLPKRTPLKTMQYKQDGTEDNKFDIFEGDKEMDWIIVLLHGGYWYPKYNKDHLIPLAFALSDLGLNVLLPEYNRVPSYPDSTFQDIKAFFEYLKKAKKYESSKLILIGHSVGGHMSIMSNHFPNLDVKGQILLAPVSDMELTQELNLGDGAVRKFLGQSWENRKDLDPMSIKVIDLPTVIIHGEEDSKVPFETSLNYVKYARNEYDIKIDLITLKNIGHFEIINPLNNECFNKLVEMINHLKNKLMQEVIKIE